MKRSRSIDSLHSRIKASSTLESLMSDLSKQRNISDERLVGRLRH